jgi:hypothetical protein
VARFPDPCPVCGSEDEHASWRAGVTGSPATFCPHPAEPGHGTGCCCAGLAIPPWIVRPVPPTLEQRVAALEKAAERAEGRGGLGLSGTQVKAVAAQIQANLLQQAKRSRRAAGAA